MGRSDMSESTKDNECVSENKIQMPLSFKIKTWLYYVHAKWFLGNYRYIGNANELDYRGFHFYVGLNGLSLNEVCRRCGWSSWSGEPHDPTDDFHFKCRARDYGIDEARRITKLKRLEI